MNNPYTDRFVDPARNVLSIDFGYSQPHAFLVDEIEASASTPTYIEGVILGFLLCPVFLAVLVKVFPVLPAALGLAY